MAINRFEFLHNDTVFGLSGSPGELNTTVPKCGSNTDTTKNKAGTVSSSFITTSTIKTPSSLSKTKFRSPYLITDKVHVVSRRTEQTCMQRTATSLMSSFPYTADLYKASSDQFKALKNNKIRKPKKSVLTLPTQPAPMPQECTVSDMNESEYYRDELEKTKPKRITQMKKKKYKAKKAQKIIDRDMKYCRQFNIDLYCSSTDSATKVDYKEKKPKITTLDKTSRQHDPHDVWSVLRSINKFQFRPTPTSSNGSKRVKMIKKHRKVRDHAVKSLFASCCTTEEFAYISTADIKQDEECINSNTSEITVINELDRCKRFFKTAAVNQQQKSASKDISTPNGVTHNKTNNKVIAQVNARNTNRKVLLKNALEKKTNFVADLSGKPINRALNNILSIKSSRDSMKFRNIVPLGVFACDNNKKTFNCKKNQSKGDDGTALEIVEKQKDPLNEIIKVILNKGKDLNNARVFSPTKERKPRLVTTLISAPYGTHLTKAEIRKQVNRLKYPIVVLGKEELTSAYYVIKNELSPQFGGLEKNCWPFMMEWYDIKENMKIEINKDVIASKQDFKTKNSRLKIDKLLGTEVQTSCKARREISTYSRQQSRKSICNLKDKVLEILSKKSNIQTLANKARSDNNKKVIIGESVRTTGTSIDSVFGKSFQSIPPKPTNGNVEVARIHRFPESPVRAKRLWCKAEVNNEFINNVIQKVNAGVYYSLDEENMQAFGFKEASIQTLSDKKNTPHVDDIINGKTSEDLKYIYKYDTLNSIGFDEVVTGLKVESINEGQIAVKHCITNIIIHFDVTLLPVATRKFLCPLEITFKPLHKNKSLNKVFKCDTILINNILPAELCTLMPKMMRDLLRSLETVPQNVKELASIQSDPIPVQLNVKKLASIKSGHFPVPENAKELVFIRSDPLPVSENFNEVASKQSDPTPAPENNDLTIIQSYPIPDPENGKKLAIIQSDPIPVQVNVEELSRIKSGNFPVPENVKELVFIRSDPVPVSENFNEVASIQSDPTPVLENVKELASIQADTIPVSDKYKEETNMSQTIFPIISETINTNNVQPPQLSKEMLKIIEGNFKTAAYHATFKANMHVCNVFEVSRRSLLLTTPKSWLQTRVRAIPMITSSGSNFISNATLNNLTEKRKALNPYLRGEPKFCRRDEYTLSTIASNIILFLRQPICDSTLILCPLLNKLMDRKFSMSIELKCTNFAIKFDQAGVVDKITDHNKVLQGEQVNAMVSVNTNEMVHHIENKGCIVQSIQPINNTNYVNTEKIALNSNDGFKPVSEQKCKGLLQRNEKIKIYQNKRNKFVKLYRKCKSITDLTEKMATPLVKINSVGDFLHVLGRDKSLSNVFDGEPGHIILDCVKEMKSWISEITPKQALLVLLLTNKKETLNLKRFRPIILQAIAVNRITRAHELDMEIEVIEREKFQINTDCARNSSIKYSTNSDGLLEELYWIAKTTASDYQRPFEESSETLLKSLIEKRKQLNPSYLRVMARYVGLGLLKNQSKN